MTIFIYSSRCTQCNEKIPRLYVLLAALVLFTGSVHAHDFWIEPQTFRPAAGSTVPLRLLVGQHFKGEPALYIPEKFERYVYVGPGGEEKVKGTLGDDPAGTVSIKEAGLYVVGYYSKKFDVTFDSVAEFEQYLAMEGLEHNVANAGRRASLRSGILEIYTRCAKALIQVGANFDKADRALGFPLELVAEKNPYRGERTLPLRLTYLGKPLEGALVVAFNQQAPLDKLKLHTDKDGRVVFQLNKPGVWLVTSVHIIPRPLLSRGDWESFWASLTFELPGNGRSTSSPRRGGRE